MNSIWIILCVLSFVGGMIYQKNQDKRTLTKVMIEFGDEVHAQYLMILRRQGIEINDEGKECIRRSWRR